MSYLQKIAMLVFLALASGVGAVVSAQTLTVRIQIVPGPSSRLVIEASGPPSSKWSFPDTYAGVVGLASRVEKFQLLDSQGREISVRQIAPGQFSSSAPASKFKYEMQIAPPARASDAALVSWLDADRGVLMMGDLLPLISGKPGEAWHTTARVILPVDWTAYSTENKNARGEMEIAAADRAVILLGKHVRSASRAILEQPLVLVTDSDWAFTDDEALDMVDRILKLHSEVAGHVPCQSSALVLLPFPAAISANGWSAQTRGCTVTLLMGRVPSKVGALSQLGLALTHELFHLWMPNALELSGDYDWFYEGFTMYQAARAALRLDLLTFQQFLNAIADAYNGSLAPDAQRLSLVEASRQRWTIGGSAIYSKAMVVAFLYDLSLRAQSKGKRSLNDVYRRILREHLRKSSSNESEADGNAVATSALRDEVAGAAFVDRFVNAPVAIDLQKELAPFGLTIEKLGLRTHIFVSEHLTSRQRELLKQLGYNEPRRRKD